MLAARFHPTMEPLGARLRVMIGLWAALALVLVALPCVTGLPAATDAAEATIERQAGSPLPGEPLG